MARTVDPQRVARRREEITLAAARLFGTQGYHRTTVADIARAADLSAASVFYYFPDKAAVFRAVFERDLPLAQALIARHEADDDPVGAILAIVSEQARDAADPAAPGLLVELLRRVEDDQELAMVVTRTAEVLHRGLTALVARGIDAGAIDPRLDPAGTAAWLLNIVDACYLNAQPGRDPTGPLRRTVLGYLTPGGDV